MAEIENILFSESISNYFYHKINILLGGLYLW